MAAGSLLALIDDIATILDDVALMSKVAAKKTAGVLGDDLALNAQQVTGVHADRELPVVWAVAKGSFKNKAILVPAALAISAFVPWLITPLLVIGGAFLCFEGFEKLAHKFLHSKEEDAQHKAEHLAHLADPTVDMAAVPTTDRNFIRRGAVASSSLPVPRARLPAFSLRYRPASSILTMAATRPYTPTVMASAMATSTATCCPNGAFSTVPSAITMISADRMKSVRTAPLIFSFSSATMSTVGSASARASFSCSSSPPCGQKRCAIFSKPSKHR